MKRHTFDKQPTQQEFNTLWDANIGAFYTYEAYEDTSQFTNNEEMRDSYYMSLLDSTDLWHLVYETVDGEESIIGMICVQRMTNYSRQIEDDKFSWLDDILGDDREEWVSKTGFQSMNAYLDDSNGTKAWCGTDLHMEDTGGLEGINALGFDRIFSTAKGTVQKQFAHLARTAGARSFQGDHVLDLGLDSSNDNAITTYNHDDQTTSIIKLTNGIGWPSTHALYKIF